MRSLPKFLAIFIVWVFSAAALLVAAAPAPVSLSALKTQLAAISTTENKLEFLKTALRGQSIEVKATLGAAVIKSVPADTQKDVAGQVAQILVGLKDGVADMPKLAGLLTSKLPSDMARTVAGRIAIGAGNSDPQQLAQITAAVIVSQSGTIDRAGAIAEEVTASSPLANASSIASAIGAEFAEHPRLAKEAPQIAAGITRAIMDKGTAEQVRPEIANSVAALTVLLPGSVRSNSELITQIGREVSAVIGATHPGLATTIVGITAAALKSAAGSANITEVLDSFRDTFKNNITDPVINSKLDTVVNEIELGTSDKNVTPLENQITSTSPQGTNTMPLTATQFGPTQSDGFAAYSGNYSSGPVVLPETNVVNR